MKKSILIIQESIPNYRVSFFENLNNLEGNDYCVLHSLNKQTGLNIDLSGSGWHKICGETQEFFGRRLLFNFNLLKFDFSEYDAIVLSSNFRNISFLFILVKLFFFHNKKIILWGQLGRSGIINNFKKVLYFMSHSVLFYTECELLKYAHGRPLNNKFSFLSNGLDYDSISKYNNALVIPEGRDIAFIGRVTSKSQFLEFARSKYFLDLRCDNLHIIGSAPESFISFINSLSLPFNVVFHGNVLNEADISKILLSCKLTFYPGSIGLSLIHSLSYGIPVVLHNNFENHMPEICCLKDISYDYFFEENDFQEMVILINKCLDKPFTRSLKFKLIELVKNSFTTRAMAINLNNTINKLFS